jgi:hypothetical protein
LLGSFSRTHAQRSTHRVSTTRTFEEVVRVVAGLAGRKKLKIATSCGTWASDQRFEKAVLESVRAQAAAKGFTRKVEAGVDAKAPPKGNGKEDGKVVLDERTGLR